MSVKWTEEQQKVIDLRDCDILVSAAAGSGKTAVLVERILKRISDLKHPVDVDRLLVVTFTKAAAAQMRERICDAIEKKREEFPEDANLLRQSSLIHNAMITTIDSFCLFVVRNHFEEIHLDPNFRIADEGEIKLLEMDVLDELFAANYESEENEAFLRLVDTYSGKRNDQRVKDMVSKIYRMSSSSPWPKEWILGLAEEYQAKTPEEIWKIPVMELLLFNTKRLILDIRDELKELLAAAGEPDGPNRYVPVLQQDILMLEDIESCGDGRSFCDFFARLEFGRLPVIRGEQCDVQKKEAVQSKRNRIKEELKELKEKYFSVSGEELAAQLNRLRPLAEELLRLSLSYLEAIQEKKKKRRIADFADIEHFALQILVDGKTKQPRETAQEFRRHFEEIMIDEYQDSNQVQEEILRAISRESEGQCNLFMVGDVKQSIYRFRQACPELFMEKYKSYTAEEGKHRRIDLHKNFRSRPEIIRFSNDMFYKLMHHDLGQVDYNEEAALYCGASYPPQEGMETEILLLDEAEELFFDQEEIGKKQMEARMVADRIRRLMRETRVTDEKTKKLRPLRYSDIVILFRSLKDWGTEFANVLEDCGIPAHVESSTGYFSAAEVQTVLSMLRILDNPYQDIPMAAVLRSPMAGLTEEELAEIRVEHPEVSFAEAVLLAMKEAEEAEPLGVFYGIYQNLRKEKDAPVHELIEKILADTGYGNYAAALPAGEQRAANLYMLLEKAIAYEKTSYKGLFHFVRYIDQLQKYEIDFGEADVTGENADVVHIMTIHKSKGLEFPVVFVSGLSKQFNRMDIREPLVVHPRFGMGIYEVSSNPKLRRECLLRTAIADDLEQENLGEELRVLYVALTRAKEKLLLTGVIKEKEKLYSRLTGNALPQEPLRYRQRVGAASYCDWIVSGALSYPDRYEISFAEPQEMIWEEIGQRQQEKETQRQLEEKIQNADETLVQQLETQFSYEYPYRSEAGKKSKYSVSELKHASMLRQYDREENEAQIPDFLLEEKESYIPDFAREAAEEAGVNPGALRGTAVHRVMECMDFAALGKLDRSNRREVSAFVEKELARMMDSGELSQELRERIYPPAIEAFVSGALAGRMAAAAEKGTFYREKPFVMEQEGVLVQGIIDAFWMEDEKIVLLDYKTDRVSKQEELIMRYQTQMELYADALSRVFSTDEKKITVKECLLYSFRLQEVVSL